jgi:hypothetical protein
VAIGVAVERDAGLGAEVLDGQDQRREVLGLGRIGVVVWEVPVHVTVERDDVEPEFGVERHRRRTARAVAGIDDDLRTPLPEAQGVDRVLKIGLCDVLP